MGKIRVLLVDDDKSWLDSISRFLNNIEYITIVGRVESREEAIAFLKVIPSDVVLMDIMLTENNLDGIETTLEICNNCNSRVIMLTSLKNEDIILDSFTAGAVHYLPKEDFKTLPEVIKAVYTKSIPYEILLKKFKEMKKEEQLQKLSPCEKEIFYLMEEGVPRAKMEELLYKSDNTVKKFISQILKKLGVKSTKEAIKKVNRRGL